MKVVKGKDLGDIKDVGWVIDKMWRMREERLFLGILNFLDRERNGFRYRYVEFKMELFR